MKIDIARIKIDEETRIRQDIGDLNSLEESIRQVGLINPVLIDENDILIAGFRRLCACRNLGWKEIEVKVVELHGDELKMLETEIAENFYRKEFTPEEILSTERRRQEIEEARRPKGAFERFWTWLKGLFGTKPEAKEKDADHPATAAPVQVVEPEPEKQNEQAVPGPEPETQSEAAAPEPEPEPQNETAAPEQEPPKDEAAAEPEPVAKQSAEIQANPGPNQASPLQDKTPEITEKDGVRHIRWR